MYMEKRVIVRGFYVCGSPVCSGFNARILEIKNRCCRLLVLTPRWYIKMSKPDIARALLVTTTAPNRYFLFICHTFSYTNYIGINFIHNRQIINNYYYLWYLVSRLYYYVIYNVLAFILLLLLFANDKLLLLLRI